jgi:acyl-CoA thioester hydrolase
MTESEIVYRYRLRVRESEVDRQQVVFNSRYLEYADVVIGEFLRSRGIPLVGDDLPFMHVRRAVVEYLRPLHFDDVVWGEMRRPQHRRTSVTFLIAFRNELDQQLAATAEIVYVHVDPSSGRAQPYPQDFIERISASDPLENDTFRR